MAINVNRSGKVYTTQYSNLRGVDFSSGAENVHERRTPTGTNLISDEGGNPKKRRGWEKIQKFGDQNFHKIWSVTYSGNEYLVYCTTESTDDGVVVRVGSYDVDTAEVSYILNKTFASMPNINGFYTPTDTDSTFSMIVDDTIYEFKDASTGQIHLLTATAISPYVPLVTIGGQAETGGGTSYESFNLVTKRIRESFISPSSYTYMGDTQEELDTAKATDDRTYTKLKAITLGRQADISKGVKITIKLRSVNKKLSTSSKYTYTFGSTHELEPLIELMDGIELMSTTNRTCIGDEAEWIFEYKNSNWYSSCKIYCYDETGDYILNVDSSPIITTKVAFTDSNKIITFDVDSFPVFYPYIDGEDNIEVEYTFVDSDNSYKAKQDAFMSCSTSCIFDERTWFTGAKGDYGNRVWYTDITHNDYFPELNYIVVGSNDTDVAGLCNLGEYLGVIKQQSANESTTYLAYPTTFDNDRTYATKTYVSGVGAVAHDSFADAEAEVLFLSKDGIYGLNTSKIYNRSWYLNGKLCEEENLENATAIMFNRYYILSVNGHCYILDTRQKLSWGTEYTNYLYAGYYWENLNARQFCVHKGELYFIDNNYWLCRLRDKDSSYCYSDGGRLTGRQAIYCEWTTPLDDDGSPQLYKTLKKKGAVVTLTHYPSTSAKITLNVDDNKTIDIGTFSSGTTENDAPLDCFIKKKVKKYKRLQIKVSNNVLDEPFKIESITKMYSVQGYAKKKAGDGVVRSDS